MTIQPQHIIGDLVAKDYRTATIFKKYHIDFCCQGNRSIQSACNDQNLNTDEVLLDLKAISQEKNSDHIDFESWPLDLIVDYIEKKHHRYVEDKSNEIMIYLNKISKVHGDKHPELHEINELFKASVQDLAAHMKKEELILFPFIKKMEAVKRGKIPYTPPRFETVENPIAMMQEEHSNEGERFRQIEELTDYYTPPEDACNTYTVTYAQLKEFEADLHFHIHLENNILFPKALALENSLRSSEVSPD